MHSFVRAFFWYIDIMSFREFRVAALFFMLTIGIKRGVSTRGIHHKLIWRHWAYKMPVRYILSSVWVRLSIFAPLSIIKYVGLYAFSLPIPLVIIERIQCIYTLSYYHHQIGSMNYYPLFRVRSWNNGIHCMSCYFLILMAFDSWATSLVSVTGGGETRGMQKLIHEYNPKTMNITEVPIAHQC